MSASKTKKKDPFEELVEYVEKLEEGTPPRKARFDHGGE